VRDFVRDFVFSIDFFRSIFVFTDLDDNCVVLDIKYRLNRKRS
jgi:hypothetical protein